MTLQEQHDDFSDALVRALPQHDIHVQWSGVHGMVRLSTNGRAAGANGGEVAFPDYLASTRVNLNESPPLVNIIEKCILALKDSLRRNS